MARPASEAKLGFFPLHPEVVALLGRHMTAPEPEGCTILDPCAGEGEAVAALAAWLGVPEDGVHAVELSASRSATIARTFPRMHLLGPASFMGTEISYNAFSLCYLNPPYSSEMGGGRREEQSFLTRAIRHVIPGGLVALVVPEDTVLDWGRPAEVMRRTLSCQLADVTLWKPPAEHRQYRELIVLATRRKQALPIGDGPLWGPHWYDARESIAVLGTTSVVYPLPPGKHPKNWRRTMFTPAELSRAMAASPLMDYLAPQAAAKAPSPPLPPGRGHVALILASGDLDGLVWPEGEPPHVVRGTATKVSYRDLEKCEERTNEDGSVSSKEVYSERIVLVVRAVAADGPIRTFSDSPSTDPEESPTCPTDGPISKPN